MASMMNKSLLRVSTPAAATACYGLRMFANSPRSPAAVSASPRFHSILHQDQQPLQRFPVQQTSVVGRGAARPPACAASNTQGVITTQAAADCTLAVCALLEGSTMRHNPAYDGCNDGQPPALGWCSSGTPLERMMQFCDVFEPQAGDVHLISNPLVEEADGADVATTPSACRPVHAGRGFIHFNATFETNSGCTERQLQGARDCGTLQDVLRRIQEEEEAEAVAVAVEDVICSSASTGLRSSKPSCDGGAAAAECQWQHVVLLNNAAYEMDADGGRTDRRPPCPLGVQGSCGGGGGTSSAQGGVWRACAAHEAVQSETDVPLTLTKPLMVSVPLAAKEADLADQATTLDGGHREVVRVGGTCLHSSNEVFEAAGSSAGASGAAWGSSHDCYVRRLEERMASAAGRHSSAAREGAVRARLAVSQPAAKKAAAPVVGVLGPLQQLPQPRHTWHTVSSRAKVVVRRSPA